LLQSLHQHKDVVTCVAAGTDSRTVVSGSRDTTLVIWDAVPPPKVGKSKQKGPVSLVLRDRPRHVLYGHSDAVACLALSFTLLWRACQVAALALLGRAAFSNQVRILTASTATEYALDADEQIVKAAMSHAT